MFLPIEHKNGDDQRYDDDDDGDNGMVVMMVLQEEAPGRSDYSFQYSILDDDTGITHSRYVK